MQEVPRADASALVKLINSTTLLNKQLSAICQLNGLTSSGVKAHLQARITNLIQETINQRDLARFRQIESSQNTSTRPRPWRLTTTATTSSVVQALASPRGFPVNNAVGVLRWRATPKVDDASACPITFTVWINNDGGKFNLTVEYELTGGEQLDDVSVIIPYQSSEPVVSSFDAAYEVSGDTVEWNIGSVTDENPSGSFEFEAETNDENDFFPMTIRFSKATPYVDVDVSSVTLLDENEEVTFSKDIKSVADNFIVE